MGLRTRLKDRLVRTFGRQEDPPDPPSLHPSPLAERSAVPHNPLPMAPRTAAAPVAAKPAAPPSAEAAEQQAKIERARTKARKGVLKHVLEQGNALPMGDAHDYSERRFFIAHKGFSDMMEWWIERGYVTYSADEGVLRVTDAGRVYAEAA